MKIYLLLVFTGLYGIWINVNGEIIYKYMENTFTNNLPLTFLNINKNLTRNEVTLCIQFNLLRGLNLANEWLFSDTETNLGLQIRFDYDYGFLYYGKSPLIFKIPQNVIQPFAWFHTCFILNNNIFHVITNGILWYSHNITKIELKPIYIENIAIGSNYVSNDKLFHGKILHLNIWSLTKSVDNLLEMTKICDGKIFHDQPDVLDWSKLTRKDFQDTKSGVSLTDINTSPCFENKANKIKMIPIVT